MPLKDRTRANAVFWHGHWLLLLLLRLLLLNDRLLNMDRLLGLGANLLLLLQTRINNHLLLTRKCRVQSRRVLLLL